MTWYSIVEEVEQDLLNDIQSVGIMELDETNSGRQVLDSLNNYDPEFLANKLRQADELLDNEDFVPALQQFRETSKIAWIIFQVEDDALLFEALSAARRTLQLEQDTKKLWMRHAWLSIFLAKLGKMEQARVEANKAVEMAPEKALAQYSYALANNEGTLAEKHLRFLQVMKKYEDSQFVEKD
jgi:tetratricopeptide (TPR) repeat protein